MGVRVLRAGVIPPAALLVGITSLGVMMALMPANRLLTLLGLQRWRLAALFIPLVGPFVFMWLVAFPGRAACAPAEAARR
ncbi:hypothetical protein MXAZACID_10578 [Acidocella sp. MX-AZ02]|nr:hypothetical protein MXAZACID_10578 [Acidocella sp. MX-AZ02]